MKVRLELEDVDIALLACQAMARGRQLREQGKRDEANHWFWLSGRLEYFLQQAESAAKPLVTLGEMVGKPNVSDYR